MIEAIHCMMINECCKTGIGAIEILLMFIGIESVLAFKPPNR